MGMRGARRGPLFVALVAAFTLLSACSGDAPQPSELEEGDGGGKVEQKKTPTPTPTPTPTEPELDDHEQQLYDATVTFYDTINEAYRTLNTGPVDELIVPGSKAASGYTNYIEDAKAKGHKFVDVGEYTFSDFGLDKDGDDSIETVEFTLTHEGGIELDADGAEVHQFTTDPGKAKITFKQQGETWLVVTQDIIE